MTSSRTTGLPADVADLLVQRMVAERIRQDLIRMFPPESIFAAQKFVALDRDICDSSDAALPDLTRGELVPGLRFQPPRSATVSSTIPRVHVLPRFREVFGDWQLAASL